MMIADTSWHIRFNRQQNTVTEADVPVNGASCEKDGVICSLTCREEGGIVRAAIDLRIPTPTLTDTAALSMEEPVRISLPLEEKPERITAFYMFNPWWTRPAFVGNTGDIPEKTQLALFKMKDRVTCLLPMVGNAFKSTLAGGEPDEITLVMSACLGGITHVGETLFLIGEGRTAAEAVHKIFMYLAETAGLRLRSERELPEMFRYLGWCSWDAFYTDVTETKIREKAAELVEKQVPVRWILIDDGWFGAEEKMIADLAPDGVKFPNGFKAMTDDIRKETSVRWFGVWHALGGYWDGVAPGSRAALDEAGNLFHDLSGRLVPDPERGAYFYRDWYDILRREGIDFVKVDGQSAVPFYYKNAYPLAEAARKINFSLESGVTKMGGAVINCMGMAMENILARPSSAVSRNSDDFLPAKEESFAEHLLQNAYNAIYHNEIYCCDWDMFWTSHPHAGKHALLRAMSGGPVYVSDRIGATELKTLKPLAYADGEVLMMERSAQPAEECIFSDPMKDGVLKLQNCGRYGIVEKAGGIAVFNLTGERQDYRISPAEVPELDPERNYIVYDYRKGTAMTLTGAETLAGSLEAGDYGWFVFVPEGKNGSCLGLRDKYAGFTAVEASFAEGDTDTHILHGSGDVAFFSARKPVRAAANGADVTGQIESAGNIHTLRLPERAGKTVVSITWE